MNQQDIFRQIYEPSANHPIPTWTKSCLRAPISRRGVSHSVVHKVACSILVVR